MGAYLYKVTGKPIDICIDGEIRQARKIVYWAKPYWSVWEEVVSGGPMPRFLTDSEKRAWRSYSATIRGLERSEPVSVLLLENDPGEWLALVYPKDKPRRWVWDDPNWENARILRVQLP
jgi:hypothetical protein